MWKESQDAKKKIPTTHIVDMHSSSVDMHSSSCQIGREFPREDGSGRQRFPVKKKTTGDGTVLASPNRQRGRFFPVTSPGIMPSSIFPFSGLQDDIGELVYEAPTAMPDTCSSNMLLFPVRLQQIPTAREDFAFCVLKYNIYRIRICF